MEELKKEIEAESNSNPPTPKVNSVPSAPQPPANLPTGESSLQHAPVSQAPKIASVPTHQASASKPAVSVSGVTQVPRPAPVTPMMQQARPASVVPPLKAQEPSPVPTHPETPPMPAQPETPPLTPKPVTPPAPTPTPIVPPIPQPHPMPPAPQPTPHPQPSPEPFRSIPHPPPPRPTIPTPPVSSNTSPLIKPLRTFKNDLEEALQSQKESVVSIATAEHIRKVEQQKVAPAVSTPRPPRNIGKVVGVSFATLLLFAGGAAAVGFFYMGYLERQKVTVARPTPSLLTSNAKVNVEIGSLAGKELASELHSKGTAASVSLGEVAEIIPISSTPQGNANLTAGDFLTRLGTKAPSSLGRALNAPYFLGMHMYEGGEPFLVFKTNYYDIAFGGMLVWEESIAQDLATLFGLDSNDFTVSGTSTPAGFTDKVIQNRDVRVLTNSEGKQLLVYSFPDKQTLVIARSEATLIEAFRRLAQTARSN